MPSHHTQYWMLSIRATVRKKATHSSGHCQKDIEKFLKKQSRQKKNHDLKAGTRNLSIGDKELVWNFQFVANHRCIELY